MMEIVVLMLNGTTLGLVVSPDDTVRALKMQIQNKVGDPVERQRLVFDNGRRTPLNDDSRTLRSYNLQSGSRVSLLVTQPPATIQVFLKNDKGHTNTYDIRPDETVEHFKKRVQEREGVPVSQQVLVHESRTMGEGRLSDYNVKEHSTIFLNLRLRGG